LNISLPQVLFVLGIIISLWVIIDFNRRIQSEQRIASEASQLRADVSALAATKAALTTELAVVSSDGYVAQWAHAEGRYVQPGEVLVVPLPAKDAAEAAPAPAPAAQTAPPSNFEIWWDVFFGPGR
jgi:cell division protein FtsB